MNATDVALPAVRVLAAGAELLPEEVGEYMPSSSDVRLACVRAARAAGVVDLEEAHRCADHAGRVLVNHLISAGLIRWDAEHDANTGTWALVAGWLHGRGLTDALSTIRGLALELGELSGAGR